jgi:hypothetical protein
VDSNEGAKISNLNKAYDRNRHLKDVDFLNGILDDLKIPRFLKKILGTVTQRRGLYYGFQNILCEE